MKILPFLFVVVAFSASAEPPAPAVQNPSFQIDTKAKRTLAVQAVSIARGDSYQSVIKKLGSPTYDDKRARKKTGEPRGRNLTYYAVKWEADTVNEFNDELVEVFLDKNNRVQSVYIRIKFD